uniref:Tetratricopeptide repeat protein n=1 Tax=viral metagenome TaxID=1070528 RepID=A0A6M3KY53_9ZZZZ
MIGLRIFLTILVLKLVWEGIKPSIGFWYLERCPIAKPGKFDFSRLSYLEKAYKYTKDSVLFNCLFTELTGRRMLGRALEIFYEAKLIGSGDWHKASMYLSGAIAHQNLGSYGEAMKCLRMASLYVPLNDKTLPIDISRMMQIFRFAEKQRKEQKKR